MADISTAFVTACGRSGTTALTGLLNRHPDVFIGYERYAKLANTQQFTPELFTPERFADVRDEDTHPFSVKRHREIEDLRGQLDQAKVIGDKIPGLFDFFDDLKVFGRPKVIFILREPFGVAKSFDARANNPNDNWPAHRDYKAAIERFNVSVAALNRAKELDLFPIHVVCYEDLFMKQVGLNEMFEFLGVDPARLGDTSDIFAKAQKLADQGRLSEMAQSVAMGVDFDAYRRTMQLVQEGRLNTHAS